MSVHPDWFRKTGFFDVVRCGEAEKNLTGFPGVSETPLPITPVLSSPYKSKGSPQFSTMLTRGCPYRCLFCANHLTHGRDFRKIPIQEIMALLEKNGAQRFHLNLEDDNLLADSGYFLNFLETFHTRYPESTLTAENGLDYRHLTPSLISRMIDSGFIRFNLSMASSDTQILSDQHRAGRSGQLSDVLHILEQNKVPSVTYFICGLEGDSLETVTRNLLFLASQPTQIGISPFYAVPGLPGFEHPGKGGLPAFPALYCGSSVWPWNNNLTTAQLITAFRLSRFINLVKSQDKANWQDLIHQTLKTKRLHSVRGSKSHKTIFDVPHMDEELCEMVLSGLPEASNAFDS